MRPAWGEPDAPTSEIGSRLHRKATFAQNLHEPALSVADNLLSRFDVPNVIKSYWSLLMSKPSRRFVLAGVVSLIGSSVSPVRALAQSAPDSDDLYAAVPDEPFPVPAVNLSRIRPEFLRTVVPYESTEVPGTIIIDPAQHFLFVVNGDGRAIRYGVGVGREGFLWSGNAEIKAKREWPGWHPPKEMIARDPSIMRVMTDLNGGPGMPGGPGNPLGARAMYLFQGDRDTLYRIHGTIEPWTIGTSVSSGCIRMINQDVIDLYSRIPVGTKVIVLGNAQPSVADRRRRYSAEQGSAAPGGSSQDHAMFPDQDPYFATHGGPEYDPYAGQY
jgi:lipoprotein-anchoring transpeptidase ErfK/SrfK